MQSVWATAVRLVNSTWRVATAEAIVLATSLRECTPYHHCKLILIGSVGVGN